MAKNHVFTDTRIQTKRDTSANWELNNPVLLNGEEILVDTNAGEIRKKVGDGTKTYTQLPFTDEPLRTLIAGKVDKVDGKGLSTEDYTTSEKEKLNGIEEGANKTIIDTELSTNSTNPVQNKIVTTALNTKVETFYVTVTQSGENYTTDKSSVDIIQAYNNGKIIYCKITYLDFPYILPLVNDPDKSDGLLAFGGTADQYSILVYVFGNTAMINFKYLSTSDIATTTSDGLMSSTDKTKLDAIASGAEVNQNAFSNIKVGNSVLAADTKMDTVEMVAGSNVSISAANDKITISATDTTYLEATTSTDGLMSSEDKTKLDGIESGANKYVHPDTHAATIITQDTTHRFVTDDQISAWNAKASTDVATQTANGLMSSEDKTKLDGIEANANNYTHPSTHPATMIVEDSTHRFVTDDQISDWNAKAADIASHIANTSNPHSVTKAQVGLGNVTNDAQVKRSEMGTVSGVATLDTIGRIPTSQMPTTVNSHLTNTSNPHSVTKSQVGLGNVTNDAQVKRTEMGVASGVATLDTTGKVPSSQLPSYVDDVIEGYYYNSKFYQESDHTTEITGESGKIYVDLDTNKTYRWSGTAYVVISETLALGETASTAYAGDKGKANADAIATIQTKLSGIEDGANKYVHPSYTEYASGLYKITTNSLGHVSAATAVAKSDITALGIPAQDTTYTTATTSADGLMSKTDKANLEDVLTRLAEVEAKLQTAVFYA